MNSLPGNPNTLHQALTLGRISNLPTVWTNCLAAWTINLSVNGRVRSMPKWNEIGILQLDLLVPLILGASLLYMGGCTLNDALDEKFDREHNPHRLIPSGIATPRFVWILGISEMLAGAWVLLQLAQCETTWVLSLGVCIIAYDILHKKWVGGVFLMGGCRLLLWASAATCGEHTEIYPLTWIWGGTLAFYVVGISLFARGEAKEGEDAPRISILFLFASPLVALAALIHWNNLDPIRVFLINGVGLFIAWIAFQAIIQIREGKKGAIGQGVSRLLAGICVTDAVVISFCMPMLLIPLLCLYAFALLLQKKFAAT